MEIIKLNIKGHYFYCPDLQIENKNKHLNKQKLLSECAICKRFILEASYENITNNRNIILENEVTIGKCGHLYHSDCINSWLKTNTTCPIDKVEWQTFRIADTTTKLILNENNKDEIFDKHEFDNKKYNNKVQVIKDMAKKNNNYPQ